MSSSGLVGRTLNGKWRLEALLGVGGSAAVYAASHRNGKRVAVKVLHPELSRNEELVARFLREGYAANQVGHPGVASVMDDDRTEDGLVYVVMDLLEGRSLDAALEPGPLALEEALRIGEGVLDVLAAAHARGIVHRDVKPQNVFLCSDGSIKLIDFGIAKLAAPEPTRPMTQAGAIFGTPGFMPPEQALGRAVDARTDVWAAAATLYTMSSGALLHDASTPNESLLRAMTEPVAPMRELLPTLPVQVADVLDRALAFEASARHPNASAMLAALRAARSPVARSSVASAAPLAVSSPSLVPAPGRRRLGVAAALAAALVVIVCGVAGLVAARSSPRSAEDIRATDRRGGADPHSPARAPASSGGAAAPASAPLEAATAGGPTTDAAPARPPTAQRAPEAPAGRAPAPSHGGGEPARRTVTAPSVPRESPVVRPPVPVAAARGPGDLDPLGPRL